MFVAFCFFGMDGVCQLLVSSCSVNGVFVGPVSEVREQRLPHRRNHGQF